MDAHDCQLALDDENADYCNDVRRFTRVALCAKTSYNENREAYSYLTFFFIVLCSVYYSHVYSILMLYFVYHCPTVRFALLLTVDTFCYCIGPSC